MKKLAIWKNPVHFLAFGLGSGLSPVAPGTVGSLLALPIGWYGLQVLTLEQCLVVLVVAFLLGIYLCGATAKALGVHDHGGIVWDEFVGQWLTLLAIPLMGVTHWLWYVAAFALFRLFDIWKPWPIRGLDIRVRDGFGIMIDDVVAGVYALLCMLALHYISLQL